MLHYKDVLKFWFEDLEPKDWFSRNLSLDQKISNQFKDFHSAALRCELFSWRETPEGRLAEIIVLDQFSRNIYRDDARAFSSDNLALALAQEAVHRGVDQKLSLQQRTFLYMPYMHSESLKIHEVAVALFGIPGLEYNLDYELQHKKILERFGRYPHRNKILKRESTLEEIEFLKEPNSSF